MVSNVTPNPYQYNNPFYKFLSYNSPYYNSFGSYGGNAFAPTYSQIPFEDNNNINSFGNNPNLVPSLNILPEAARTISTRFTVVPLVVVSKETMTVVNGAEIVGVSKQQPTMVITTFNNRILQCTPAVKIVLDEPLVIYSLKNSIPFPSEILVRHGNYRIPIRVGAVIAPIGQNTYVSADTPVYLKIVYAISTTPLNVDYINNVKDVAVPPDTDTVVVENEPALPLPPKNVTILNFPETIGEPSVSVDEEDEELGKLLLLFKCFIGKAAYITA